MSSHQPFMVTWELHSPVIVPNIPIHLDALLSWARVQEELDVGNAGALDHQHDIGLTKHEVGDSWDSWCFMASVVDFNYTGVRQQLHYIKRADIDEYANEFTRGTFGTRKPYFDPKRGATKAASIQIHQAFASTARAYGVGDIDRVRELLDQVTSLGKLRRRGKGSIRSCQVEECSQSKELWAKRNLPPGSALATPDTHALAQQRLFAPYWSKDRHLVLAPV